MPHTSGLPDVTPESVRWPVPSCPPHVVPEQAVTLKRQRPQPLEPRSGSGFQGAGPRPRLAADPRHHRRLGQAVQPRGARAQARSGLPAGRAVPGPPRAPLPTRGRRRAAPRAPGVNFPLASPASRVLHARVVRGLVRGSQAGAGLRAIQKLRPSWGPRVHGRALSPRWTRVQGALCECPFWLPAKPGEPAALPTSLPTSQKLHFRR